MRGRLRTRSRVGLAALAVALLAGCGGEAPVRHPVSDIQRRMRPRIAFVEFVVKDPARRAEVERILLDIEQLTFDWQRERLAIRRDLLAVSGEPGAPPLTEAELAAAFRRQSDLSARYLARYVELQLALRAVTTPEELARLDAVVPR